MTMTYVARKRTKIALLVVSISLMYLFGVGLSCGYIKARKDLGEGAAELMAPVWPVSLPIYFGYRLYPKNKPVRPER